MKSMFRAIALAAATLVLASCGGGGNSTPTSPAPPSSAPLVAITPTNAKPVSASALDSAESTSATRGASGLPIGVQVDAPDAGAPLLQVIAEAARLAASSFSAGQLPTGLGIKQTVPCTLGGSLDISGNVASASTVSIGDTLSITANACTVAVGTGKSVLSGSMTMTFQTATSSLTPPFHIVVSTTVTNMSVTTAGVTTVANGDVHLDWNATSATTQTLSASGTAISSRETVNGAVHTTTMRNFTQVLTISGSTYSGTLAATVETDSTKLGTTGTVSYTISTPTPVVWNAATRTATGGVIKVLGANNSQLLITIHADGTVTIQIDANGDGTFEATVNTTVAELAGLI